MRPEEFYHERRWGPGDRVAAVLLLAPPFAAMCVFTVGFWRSVVARTPLRRA